MTSEQLGAVAGVILSLLFSYVPGLREKFAALDSTKKSLAMAVMLLAVAGGAVALSCGQIVNVVECSKSGIIQMVSVYVAALVANQATFVLSPQAQSVKSAKALKQG